MASNDNTMTRFLFAILKQKNLKDIDWNEVAKDPILAQPITNGHAARMRYSRFKSSMLGTEPQKRSKAGVTKSKPSKGRKDQKDLTMKEEGGIKSESGMDKPFGTRPGGVSSQGVKKETGYSSYPPHFATASAASSVTPSPNETCLRLLTPCSDDMLGETPGLPMSPAPAFNLAHCTHGDDADSSHVNENWDHNSMYFDTAAFGLDLCGHHHDSAVGHHSDLSGNDNVLNDHTHDFSAATSALLHPAMTAQAPIKSEDWDSQSR